MKKFYVFLFSAIALFAVVNLTRCTLEPTSKKSYIQRYEQFVATVESNHKSFSDKTWEQKDKQYALYSGEWYKKFKPELTLQEEVIVKKLNVKYKLYRNTKSLKDGIEESIDAIKEIGSDLIDYIDTTLQETK
jgi:hypothetical protein